MWNIGCLYTSRKRCSIFLYISPRDQCLWNHFGMSLKWQLNVTGGERDVTVLHLSCPQRECVTFKPTGRERRASDLYFHLWWKGSNAPVWPATNTILCVYLYAQEKEGVALHDRYGPWRALPLSMDEVLVTMCCKEEQITYQRKQGGLQWNYSSIILFAWAAEFTFFSNWFKYLRWQSHFRLPIILVIHVLTPV